MRKSGFLAIAAPSGDVQQAMAMLATHRLTDVSHHCWAYKIGSEYRFNDDVESSGTAGKPILQAIEGQQLDGVVVLVIRWRQAWCGPMAQRRPNACAPLLAGSLLRALGCGSCAAITSKGPGATA